MPIDLVWTAPNECLRQIEVASDVARLAGQAGALPRGRGGAAVAGGGGGHGAVGTETASGEGGARRTREGEWWSAVAHATALSLPVELASEPPTNRKSIPPNSNHMS